MPNTLVNFYRQQNPNTPLSDDAITALYGATFDRQQLSTYPDALADLDRINSANTKAQTSLGQEFSKAFSRGVTDLETSAAGAVALGADLVGADRVRQAALDFYKRKQAEAAEETPAAVPSVQDIGGIRDAGLYLARLAGSAAPVAGEMALTSTAGAMAGTAAEPGGGTAAGGIAGLLARGAARKIIDEGVEKIVGKAAAESVGKELADVAAGRAIQGGLSKTAEAAISGHVRGTLAKVGGSMANAAAFYGQGAGGEFGQLSQRPDVSDADAATAAMISGGASALGALLPAAVMSKLFPGVASEVADTYLKRLASELPKEIPVGAGTMAAMELGNIAAEKFAVPEERDKPLGKDDILRIANAAAEGALLGTAGAGVAALRGPSEGVRMPAAPRAETLNESQAVRSGYLPESDQGTVDSLYRLAVSDLKGEASKIDISAIPEKFKPLYDKLKQQAASDLKPDRSIEGPTPISEEPNATQIRQEPQGGVGEHQGTNAVVEETPQDRQRQAEVSGESPPNGGSYRAPEVAREKVNPQDLRVIAQDFVDRLSRNKDLTDTQMVRFRIVRAILRQPESDANAQNLARIFDLEVDPNAVVMPRRFDFLAPAKGGEGNEEKRQKEEQKATEDVLSKPSAAEAGSLPPPAAEPPAPVAPTGLPADLERIAQTVATSSEPLAQPDRKILSDVIKRDKPLHRRYVERVAQLKREKATATLAKIEEPPSASAGKAGETSKAQAEVTSPQPKPKKPEPSPEPKETLPPNKVAPATFLGYQETLSGGHLALFNLTTPLGDTPAGSTVTAKTLTDAGYSLPDVPPPPKPSQLFSRPDIERVRTSVSSPEIQASFSKALRSMVDHGLAVDLIRLVGQEITGEFADAFGRVTGERSGGMYDRAARAATLVMADVSSPTREDLRTLFEEAGHALFDRESEDSRSLVLRAISRIGDEDLGLSKADIDQIRAAYPEGVSDDVMAEERMMLAVSRNLVNQGFGAQESMGVARAIGRLVKELYLRALMAVQKAMFGQDYVNPDVATRWFQTRLESMLHGDKSTLSFIDRLGGGPPIPPREATWMRPVRGSVAAAQSYDFESDQIHYEPAIDSTVEATAYNVGNALRFSVPNPVGIDPPDMGLRMSREVAVINDSYDIRRKAAKLAGIEPERMTALFGLPDRVAQKGHIIARSSDLQNFNPDASASKFRHDFNAKPVQERTYANAANERDEIAAKTADAKIRIESAKRNAARKRTKHTGTILKYLDAEGLTSQMTKDVKSMAADEIRQMGRESRRLGIIEQQLAQIDEQSRPAITRRYTRVFANLFTGTDLSGDNLYGLLDKISNDPSIDLGRGIRQVRADIKRNVAKFPDPDYVKLAGDDDYSKALLATVVAYVKTNKLMMDALEARRMKSGKERESAMAAVREIKSEKLPELQKSIGKLARTAKIEERLRKDYVVALREIKTADNEVAHLEAVGKTGESAVAAYRSEMSGLEAALKIRKQFFFGNDQEHHVPRSFNATTDEILGDPKQGIQPATKKIQISATGKIDTPQELDADLARKADFIAYRENRARQGDAGALDIAYHTVRNEMREIIEHIAYEPMRLSSDHRMTELFASRVGKQVGSVGSPSARAFETAINQFSANRQRLGPEGDRMGYRNQHNEESVLSVLSRNGKRVNRSWYRDYVLNPALNYAVEQSRDAPEIQGLTGDALASRIFLRARNYLLSDPNIRPMIEGQIDEFMVAFRRHVEGLAESSRFMDAVNRESGMAVESKLLGKKERESYPVGPITVSRTINNNTFQSMMTALRGSGWELAESMLKDAETLYDSADPADRARLEKALSMLVNHPAHGDTVTRLFLGEIARSPYPLIDAARLEDGVTRPTGDVNVIKSALEAATDPVTGRVNVLRWAEGMHSAYGAQGPVGQYVSDVISDLLDVYQRAKGLDARLNPETRPRPATLENLLPDVMIDARTIDDLPGTWFRYRTFDRMDNIRIIERLAGQLAFGRDSKRLANDFETARSEVRADVAKLEEIEEQARRRSPTGSTRDVKKTAAEISGSVQEYDRLRQSRRRLKILDQAFNGLYRHFREKNDPIGAWHVGLRFAQELAGLLVNQPSSAIAQMATLFDAAVRYGASPTILKTVGKTIKTSAKDLVGSLAQGIGWELFRNSWSEEESDFQRLGLGDPQSARRFGDVFIRYEHETQPMAFLRGMREAQAFGANRLGERARFTIMKPLAPFFTGITSANKGLTIALWSLAKNYVNRAIEFYGENPLDVGRTEALTSADLGLSGKLESDSFARFSRDLKSRGLDFDRMALAARERALHGDKTILTDRELALINEIALDEVSLESNIATTPLGMFNNTVLGMAMPLLGWSYRRMLQVAGLRLDTNEKNSLRALGTGLMGLTVAAGGGLALSAVIDWYMEHLVGKVRNLQPAFTGIRPNPAAMLERINRIGTFGFFGELANTAVNVGTGQGDNRAFSVDQRVIFMNSIQSVMTAMSNLINQHFVADYQHVTRPFIQAIGGGGMLQYMDVLDHSLGLDGLPVFGSEARIVARINAENYLRIAGRALNLSVRTGQAVGFGTPTPVTPYLSRMEMAAYANDAGDFKSAYLDAVQAARKQGKENPEAYVRAAFATRHPLRYVFQQPPTMQEYQQILNFLSERGREDVQSAIRLFNHYEEQIGVRPYIGRVQSRSTGQQARAMGASVFSSTP